MKTEFITLSDLFGVLKKRLLPILLAAVLCGGLTYLATTFMTKEYSATASFYVRNLQSQDYIDKYGVNASQAAASQTMAKEFADIVLRSDLLLDSAIGNINENEEDGYFIEARERNKLRKMLSTDTENRSAVFYVTVTCEDRAFADVFIKALEQELPAALTSIAWADVNEQFSCVVSLQSAAPARQSAPRFKLLTAIGAAAGMLITYIVFLLVFLFGTKIRTEEDVLRALPKYPIVGRIPHWTGAQLKQTEEVE